MKKSIFIIATTLLLTFSVQAQDTTWTSVTEVQGVTLASWVNPAGDWVTQVTAPLPTGAVALRWATADSSAGRALAPTQHYEIVSLEAHLPLLGWVILQTTEDLADSTESARSEQYLTPLPEGTDFVRWSHGFPANPGAVEVNSLHVEAKWGLDPTAFPVEWLYFEAKTTAEGVALNWATAQELNSDRFEVERSADGTEWANIGQVAAAGWADSKSEYRFTDTTASGRMYYRLRQVDFDGATDYSSVVEAVVEAPTSAGPTLRVTSCAGNPQVHGLEVGATGMLQVYDLRGQLVYTSQVYGTGQPVTVALPDLPAGLYTATITDGHGGIGKVLIK